MRDYSLLFGLAVLGLIVGSQKFPSLQRPAAAPRVPPAAPDGKVNPDQSPGSVTK
jgi:hypothetical protein